MLPFTADQFFQVFADYNTATYPMSVVLTFVAVIAIMVALHRSAASSVVVSIALAGLWSWSGVVYHITFFSGVNPVAVLFGIAFAIEAGLLLYAGVTSRTLQFRPGLDLRTTLGGLSIIYALLIYPLLGWLTGHTYPQNPTFGAPCPVTMFTFGLLLWARMPRYLLAVPIGWSIVGVTAVWNFGVLQDSALVPIAAIVIALEARKRRRSRSSPASRYA